VQQADRIGTRIPGQPAVRIQVALGKLVPGPVRIVADVGDGNDRIGALGNGLPPDPVVSNCRISRHHGPRQHRSCCCPVYSCVTCNSTANAVSCNSPSNGDIASRAWKSSGPCFTCRTTFSSNRPSSGMKRSYAARARSVRGSRRSGRPPYPEHRQNTLPPYGANASCHNGDSRTRVSTHSATSTPFRIRRVCRSSARIVWASAPEACTVTSGNR
jgi:hypothetical protein